MSRRQRVRQRRGQRSWVKLSWWRMNTEEEVGQRQRWLWSLLAPRQRATTLQPRLTQVAGVSLNFATTTTTVLRYGLPVLGCCIATKINKQIIVPAANGLRHCDLW